tara:strand:+ start:797 stop:1108 length:312 start_codon:yes stop_codon:yes gene_type:complete
VTNHDCTLSRRRQGKCFTPTPVATTTKQTLNDGTKSQRDSTLQIVVTECRRHGQNLAAIVKMAAVAVPPMQEKGRKICFEEGSANVVVSADVKMHNATFCANQ